jgi:hypothetical protein
MNFLENYELFSSGNEASPLFHTWSAINVLSAAVSRRIFFDQSYFKVYANMYVVLVGEPGDKKTTALSLARSMVQKTKRPIAPPSATIEAITVLMSDENDKSECHITYVDGVLPRHISHLSFYASEIVTMLSAGGNPQGLIEFFTDIYDREAFEVLTKNKGNDIIDCPYITILACMTPEQTGQLLKEKLITGGFSRRCVFVYGRSKADPIPRPKLHQYQIDAKNACLDHLEKILKFKGEYTMTPGGEEFFDDWYNKKHAQLMKPNTAPFKNWLRSKDTMLIKLAMLLDCADGMTRQLDENLLARGVEMLDSTEKDLHRVFAGSGTNPQAELASKMLARIEATAGGKMSAKALLHVSFSEGSEDEQAKALDYLIRTGQVRKANTQEGDAMYVFIKNG